MKTWQHKLFNSVALVALLTLSAPAFSETAEEKGFAIAARSDRSDRDFADSETTATMVLRNARGQESKRVLKQRIKEVADETYGDKSIIIFQSPADVDGTAMLSHANILDPDDQWLYLPALKRIKRISSKNKSGPFVGSEFAFEDFTAQELGKFDYKFIKEEPCPDNSAVICDVVERTPKYEFSGYTRQMTWIDQPDYQVRRIDFYDRKNDLLKTLDFKNYKKYKTAGNDNVWRAQTLAMTNHLTGKSSDFLFGEYSFDLGLKKNDFEKGTLKRAR